MPDVVAEIAAAMGVTVDSRTALNASYQVPYPVGYSMREILGYIACAHAGNWIITDAGELYLVPLAGMPAETNYLVTEYGDAITLGRVRLLV